MNLFDSYASVFSYMLLLARTPAARQRSFPEVRRNIVALLEKQRAQAAAQNIPEDENESAHFAVVAWIDELLLRCTVDDGASELATRWQLEPLQLAFYGIKCAGEVFFTKLDQLRPGQTAVREIYYLCLCLGFRGEADEPQREELCHTLAHSLPAEYADWYECEKRGSSLTEQPYQIAGLRGRSLDWFLWIGLAVAILIVSGIWGSQLGWPGGV